MDDSRTPKTARSKAMSDTQKRYYERTRDVRLERMRERARERTAEIRAVCANDEGVLRERRAKFVEKYHKYVASKIDRTLKEWHDDSDISATFKAFLTECVEPVKKTLSQEFFNTLSRCVIVAEKEPDLISNEDIESDGGNEDTSAEYYAYSQTIKEW